MIVATKTTKNNSENSIPLPSSLVSLTILGTILGVWGWGGAGRFDLGVRLNVFSVHANFVYAVRGNIETGDGNSRDGTQEKNKKEKRDQGSWFHRSDQRAREAAALCLKRPRSRRAHPSRPVFLAISTCVSCSLVPVSRLCLLCPVDFFLFFFFLKKEKKNLTCYRLFSSPFCRHVVG